MHLISVQATDKNWVELKGKFVIQGSPSRVILYLEGPPSGSDILLNSLVVKHAKRNRPSPPPFYEVSPFTIKLNKTRLMVINHDQR